MIPLRRKAVQAAERLPVAASRTVRQYSAKPSAATGEHAHGHHSTGPVNESFGFGFYTVLVAIPLTIGVYTFSRPGADGKLPAFSKFIDSYSHYKEKWAARNALHTAAIEQAGFDKNLFHNSKPTKHLELRFPEIFNTGSPYNVVAGHRSRNMDELVAHYEKKNTENEERKLKALAEKSG